MATARDRVHTTVDSLGELRLRSTTNVVDRLRRAVELVLGVAVGILVGDLLIYFIGGGAWQIGLAVAFATLAAVFLGGGPTVIGQAASSAVLVATLAPPQGGVYYSRFVDALIGGVVGCW